MKCETVRDFMSSPVHTLSPDQTLAEASSLFFEKEVTGAPVVSSGEVVGILSDSDIVRSLTAHREELEGYKPSFLPFFIGWKGKLVDVDLEDLKKEMGSKTVQEAMSRKVHLIRPDDSIDTAIDLMRDRDVNRLPVVEGVKLVGIVTRDDIIKCLSM
ncbi:MAG: CBS domain-containing protein [Methanomassiliicoccales archaeon]